MCTQTTYNEYIERGFDIDYMRWFVRNGIEPRHLKKKEQKVEENESHF